MFHPVGSQPASVYWRRRLIILGSLAALFVLIVMTVKIVTSGGNQPAQAQGSSSTPGRTSTSASRSSTPRTKHATPSSRHTSRAVTTSHSKHSSPPAPPECSTSDLTVAAAVAKSSYSVGDQPVLALQVTNTGASPCVQDLSDSQIVLRVYNGESRVWGSHDCKVQPGKTERVLAPKTPLRVQITWSGLSSSPGCTTTRQRVGAGTYTLYASLAGKTGKAAQFELS